MFNLKDMMGRIQEMQDKLQEAKSQLDQVIVESEAGGGMVRVTANANKKILKIQVDPDLVDKSEVELMSDLITAAVNKALEAAEVKGKEEMEKITKGVIPNIPGLDLGKFGFQG